ncbi:sn-glycerol-3-phosphate ABC transporter ATP-binding protein UgpC [Sedimentibacter sp.]|uniref:ABC transporter ATP-binding protein n=1 Tax=Sedimentibacter sp. TaxID=1960295 RepID=UPI0028AE2A9B|nr:sn-glycerol-3-phosphate ABC transporter ATP-binding protein UgpC [Sedimentibacter sp.]
MASVKFENITKEYPKGIRALKNINLYIDDSEFIVLVGPSGCGKSTALRIIAGLEDCTEGNLYIGGQPVKNVRPKDRNIAMVFQNYALYPHLTVFDNMAFGMKMRKTAKAEIKERITGAAEMLHIEELLGRKPGELSGGQKQRVALGRAIVREPGVFLLDEPLSNLDAELRAQMRIEIIKLHKKLGTTFIYVTHDQTEAMTMADRIVVMKDGTIQQTGTPKIIYENPANIFTAGFIGSPRMNFIEAAVILYEDSILLKTDSFTLPLDKTAYNKDILKKYSGRKLIAGIRPEDIDCTAGNNGYVIDAVHEITETLGYEDYVHFDVSGEKITARSGRKEKFKEGTSVKISLDLKRMHLFDKESKKNIIY